MPGKNPKNQHNQNYDVYSSDPESDNEDPIRHCTTKAKNSNAAMSVLLGTGAVAAVAATTTVHTSANGISSTTNMGPLKGSSHVDVSNGTLHSSTNQSLNLGPVGNSSESHSRTFGKEGVGGSDAYGWNIGGNHGVGHSESQSSMWNAHGGKSVHTESSNLFGVKSENTTTNKVGHGNIFSHHEEGKIFGEKYKFGFHIPAPDFSKVGDGIKSIGHALKPVADGAKEVGHALAPLGKALKPVGKFFQEAGPVIVKGAVGTAKVVGEIAKAMK